MADVGKCQDMIVDYITGQPVPNVGTEEIRQRMERYLVETKGYQKDDIRVNVPIAVDVAGDTYESFLDLVITVFSRNVMVVKCAAGSLESREREVVSAARIFGTGPVPFAVASDSKTAVVYDAVSGKKKGEGLDRIPTRAESVEFLKDFNPPVFSGKTLEKEKIIFRSYDSMNVNICPRNKV